MKYNSRSMAHSPPRRVKKMVRRILKEATRDDKRSRGAHDRWSWEASQSWHTFTDGSRW